jgi:hypothetical protein
MGDMDLVRALGVIHARNLTSPALRQYVEAYIAVQVNPKKILKLISHDCSSTPLLILQNPRGQISMGHLGSVPQVEYSRGTIKPLPLLLC